MGYRPISLGRAGFKTSQTTSLVAAKGQNKRDLPQLLNTDFALKIVNYHISAAGQLEKRKGLQSLFDIATSPITMLEEYDSDNLIFGYGTTVARYTISTDTVTNIKTDFSANTGFSGQRYGKYFFVANGVDRIWRFDETFTISEVASSPIAKGIKVIGARLYAFNLSTDETAVAYSELDDGTDPPFTNWTVGPLADAPGLVSNRVAGAVNSVEAIGDNALGQVVVVFSENGKWAFYINTIDAAGTLSKIDVFQMSRTDSGGARGALTTELGIVYVNKEGIFLLSGVNNSANTFKDLEFNTSRLLGTTFFNKISLDQVSIAYNAQRKEVYVSLAQNSSTNNLVLCYNAESKAFTEFTGWNLSRIINVRGTFYGASSAKTAVYKVFQGFADDGVDIGTQFYQELTTGPLSVRQKALMFYIQGFLSASTEITISFDIYDKNGIFIANKKRYSWTAQHNDNDGGGWGELGWGDGPFGGDIDFANTIESFNGRKIMISNYQRIRVKITEGSKTPHAINWFSLDSRAKVPIRRRKISTLN